MTVSLRLICLTGLLMGALAIPAAADQGRRDHDTPGTERQADPITPQQKTRRAAWLRGESQTAGETRP